MKRPANVFGVAYFLIHLMVETVTFYIISSYTDSGLFWYLALIYDFLAFVPQGAFGYLSDKGCGTDLAAVGTAVSAAALILFWANSALTFPVVILMSVGNCLIHVQGAQYTLRSSEGKMTPSALFVSGGSFGIILGKILAMRQVSPLYALAVCLGMLVPVALCAKQRDRLPKDALQAYDLADETLPRRTVVLLAVLVVIARAYMGYGIPTTWNRTLFQTVLLYCAMGVGKALGGILIDTVGVRRSAAVSTLGALPFLLFGDKIMAVSLIGVLLFSMTMAITLGVLVSVVKKYPGVAFGLTTVGLFLGSLPVFVVKLDRLWIECLVVAVLSAASYIILSKICKKERSK